MIDINIQPPVDYIKGSLYGCSGLLLKGVGSLTFVLSEIAKASTILSAAKATANGLDAQIRWTPFAENLTASYPALNLLLPPRKTPTEATTSLPINLRSALVTFLWYKALSSIAPRLDSTGSNLLALSRHHLGL